MVSVLCNGRSAVNLELVHFTSAAVLLLLSYEVRRFADGQVADEVRGGKKKERQNDNLMKTN